MYCPRHPKVESNLRCGKCNEVICPKCTVQTPVGARCPDCAKLTRLPTFQVSAIDYLKAVGIGVVLAIILGLGWGIADAIIGGYSYLLALVVGYIIGELISLGVRKKRGIGLQIIAGGSVGLCYAAGVFFDVSTGFYGFIALLAGIFVAVIQFR